MNLRNATIDDARDLAVLINLAGEELPILQWRQSGTEGQDPLAIGANRAMREKGSFSFRNARIAEIDGRVAGMSLSYQLPDPYELGDPGSCSDVIRPLLELEAEVPGSWYINAIATYETFRARGVATALMSLCEDSALSACTTELSLIVASRNRMAHDFYLRLGYQEAASRPLHVYSGGPSGGKWILMVKRL